MKKIPFLVIFFCGLSALSIGQQKYWQQQLDYTITVSLNDSDNTLDGYLKLDYQNNSPDTLHFLWMQLWPNAYKNDRTAFSDQFLENGRTDFYFSDFERRGYINRLDFRVNDITVKTEDHPQHQDIIKIILPAPLAPSEKIKIETPFHIKLPYNFNGNGYSKKSYQVIQWYPRPEVYDKNGWNDIPYLSQGGDYNEFGNFDVQITVPKKYVIAANGILHPELNEESDKKTKTLHYSQNNLTEFVWFADKNFIEQHDTILTNSGKPIDVLIYYKEEDKTNWGNAIEAIKQAIHFRDNMMGDYPYASISAVQNTCKTIDAAAFPGLITMNASGNNKLMALLVNHLVGYSWLGGALANNERENLWMSRGLNLFYDDKFLEEKNEIPLQVADIKSNWLKKRLPDDLKKILLETISEIKKDQPINTRADSFSLYNYYLAGYAKADEWLKLVENTYIQRDQFYNALKEYYNQWKFKHPSPEDIESTIQKSSNSSADGLFSLLNTKGNIYPAPTKKDWKLDFLFNLKDADKHNYIFIAPAAGYNYYDKLMLGIAVHNYTLPSSKFQFLLMPLYATGSSQLNGLGRISYSFYPGNNGQKVELSVSGESFSSEALTDTTSNTDYFRFFRIVPSIRWVLANKNARSTLTKYVQWKTFFIGDDFINYNYLSSDHYINQLRLVVENNRKLYPFKEELEAEQSNDFARITFTNNYYFNYQHGGGVNVRLFAGKFFYLGDKVITKELSTDPYHLDMTGPKGYEDYTYSNYFYGRNEFQGIANQQIMERDGFFKVRTDLLSSKIGKTDNWLASLNFTTDIPKSINPLEMLPFKIPLKAFLDVGTYAEAWQSNPPTSKFLYDAGLQLSLLKNVVNIYMPLFYSNVYSDYFQSTVSGNIFLQNISFSIDIQNINLRKLVPQLSF